MRRTLAAALVAATLAVPFGGTSGAAGCVQEWLGEEHYAPSGVVPLALFFYDQAYGLATCIV